MLLQAILFYFLLAAVFFIVGAYLCQQIFSLWFTETYLNASDWKLLFGGLLFWNTMYLLRYGLFVLFTGVASALVTFPLRAGIALVAFAYIVAATLSPRVRDSLTAFRPVTYGAMLLGLAAILLEDRIRRWFDRRDRISKTRLPSGGVEAGSVSPGAAVGIVYMS